MKIYPCNHNVKVVTDNYIDTDLNVPLSYITVDYSKYKIDKEVDENFNTDKKNIVLPGTEFNNGNIKIFNQYNEEVDTKNLLKIKNDKYIYSPNNQIEFEPKKFLWKATIKKNQEYKISNSYNINLSASNTNLAERMSLIFSNPSERGLLPPNIKINNNEVSENTFINSTMNDVDFAFVETPSCVYYDDSDEKINIYDYLDYNTNLWMFCRDARGFNDSFALLTTQDNYTFELKAPVIHSDVSITGKSYFDLGLTIAPEGTILHKIFTEDLATPILILEYINKGFVIISHFEMTRNIEQYKDIIYEVLMYVYLRSYKTSEYKKEWIATKIPDYEIVGGTLKAKKNFTSNVNLAKLFKISSGDYNITKIDMLTDNTQKQAQTDNDLSSGISFIKCIGSNNDRLMFDTDIDRGLDGYAEPEKPVGWISIYNNGRIYYLSELHYLIETNIEDLIYLIENDSDLSIRIYGFKSSSLGINIENSTNLTIPFIKADNDSINRIREQEYVIYLLNNHIEYCFAEDYDSSIDNQYILFKIIVGQTDDSINAYDIRQLGGGLPESEPDNYNLFDIGHINGRPYREAGTMIITLPKKYEQYKDLIESTINKWKVAESYAVIYYEDKEE